MAALQRGATNRRTKRCTFFTVRAFSRCRLLGRQQRGVSLPRVTLHNGAGVRFRMQSVCDQDKDMHASRRPDSAAIGALRPLMSRRSRIPAVFHLRSPAGEQSRPNRPPFLACQASVACAVFLVGLCVSVSPAIAEHLGVFSETISRFKRGANWPTIPRLLELAELYNVPVAKLLGRGSNRATDIGCTIADQLERLSAEDRTWVGNLLKDLCDRLPQAPARKSTTRARDRR